jgi:hypothetical protein
MRVVANSGLAILRAQTEPAALDDARERDAGDPTSVQEDGAMKATRIEVVDDTLSVRVEPG